MSVPCLPLPVPCVLALCGAPEGERDALRQLKARGSRGGSRGGSQGGARGRAEPSAAAPMGLGAWLRSLGGCCGCCGGEAAAPEKEPLLR